MFANGLHDGRPAIAEQDEWQGPFFRLARGPDHRHLRKRANTARQGNNSGTTQDVVDAHAIVG